MNGVASTAASITVAAAAPGIFLSGNRAAATNPDNSLNTSATGIGALDNAVVTGLPAPLDGPLS